MTYRHRVIDGVVTVRLTGPFDIARSLQTLVGLKQVYDTQAHGLVWDARRRTTIPKADELRALMPGFEHWRRCAIITNRPAQDGMARMAQGLSMKESVRACATKSEALRWAKGLSSADEPTEMDGGGEQGSGS